MDVADVEKITLSLPELVQHIDCNVMLISHLLAAKCIGIADEHNLITFPNKVLLNILFTRQNAYKILVEGLRKTNQTGALKILKESTEIESSPDETAGFPIDHFSQMHISSTKFTGSEIRAFKKVPVRTQEAAALFTGRLKELDILFESILPDGGTASIVGIGGIGKTELAKMFLQKLDEEENENIFRQVIWINCESSFSATTDFTTIAKDYLQIPIIGSSSQQRDISSVLNDVYEKLQLSKSLLVLDNVETIQMLQTFMPKAFTRKSKLSILTTSQNSIVKLGTQIMLGGFEKDEATEMVKKGLGICNSISQEFEKGISDLVYRLEMFPLSITQAIGYIIDKRQFQLNYEPQDYLADLYRIPKRLLDKKYFIDMSSQGKTTYKTLSLALIKIEACDISGGLASKILSKVAFMAPDNIPSEFFSDVAENDHDAIEDALALIKRFFIIIISPGSKDSSIYFSIHRLVQDVLRIRIDQMNETENCIQSVMTKFSTNLSNSLIDHALVTWRHTTKYDSLVIAFATFPTRLTHKMGSIGRISEASDFADSSLIILRNNLNIKEHASTIFMLKTLGCFYLSQQRKLEDSLKNLEEILIEAKTYLGAGDLVIFRLRFLIAKVCFDCGRNDKAILICDHLFEDFKLHDNVSFRILPEVAGLQIQLRKFESAQKTASFVLDNLRLVSENEREDIEFDTKRTLARIQGRLGNYKECIKLYSEAIQTHMIDRPSKFTNYQRWSSFHNMGTYQAFAGQFEEAHDTFQKALNEMRSQNEQECLWILCTKTSIASLLLQRDMLDEAMPFCLKLQEQLKRLVGEDDLFLLDSVLNIGVAYSKLGHYHDAVSVLARLVENKNYVTRCIDEAILAKYYFAISLEQIGDFEKALAIFNELKQKCLEFPNYKLFTLEHVESALNRLKEKVKTV